MKYATTADLIRLNDSAVRCDFNEWLTASFFDDVGDSVHVLAFGFPHGVRRDSHVSDPAHARTVWYARMKDGSDHLVLLDVTERNLGSLPEIPDTPGLLPAGMTTDDPRQTMLSALVVLRDPDAPARPRLIDGKAIVEALHIRGETDAPALVIDGLDSAELEMIRARIPF